MHVQFIHTKANQTKSPWEAYEMSPENSLCSSICFWKTRHTYFFLELSRKWVVRIVKVGVGLLRMVIPAALFYGTFRSFSPRL